MELICRIRRARSRVPVKPNLRLEYLLASDFQSGALLGFSETDGSAEWFVRAGRAECHDFALGGQSLTLQSANPDGGSEKGQHKRDENRGFHEFRIHIETKPERGG